MRLRELLETTSEKTVAKTWDEMTPKEKSSGVKGRTVWNEKTRKYRTVFDVPATLDVEQEVEEAYDHNAPFNAADFQRHMDQLRAREELRKTDPMRALVGDLIDTDREKERLAKRQPQDDDSMSTSDPRHPQYAYTQAGHQSVAEGLPQTLRKVVPGYAKREIDKKMDAGKFGKTDADKDANFQRYKKIQDKLNEFAPDGFNGGDDGEEFNPRLAKMAYDEGIVKGVSLADGATLERAMAINDWDKHDGGIYKQHFAKGFKAGRMNKINHDNKQYNLNLKLMKDGSIRHGEQGVAEGLADTQQKIVDTINELEDRLKHAKSGEQWDRISARIERLQAGLKRSKQGVAEAGPFSYGAKKPRKGSVAANAEQKRKEQERDKQPIEPRDQMVGVAKVKQGVAEAEGDAKGVPHLTKELLQHIVDQIGTEGAHAIVKSIEWGDGAAKELVQLIKHDLENHIELGESVKQRLDKSCWSGYKKQGTKMKGGVRVNNCVPNESSSTHK